MLLESVSSNSNILRSSKGLLKVRICYNFVLMVQLVFVAVVTFSIDFASAKDPNSRMYTTLQFKLITFWFNSLLAVNALMSLYCDWKETKGEVMEPLVQKVQWWRNLVMTSILFPTIAFSDTFFWRLYTKDPLLIGPSEALGLLGNPMQHVLHSLTLVNVLLDLAMVPRRKPKQLLGRWAVTMAWLTAYLAVAAYSKFALDELVYPFVGVFSGFGLLVLVTWSYVEHSFFFTLQWVIIDLLWGGNDQKKEN